MSAHFDIDGKPVSYSTWAAELEAFFEDVAEDPRNQHEAEDFEQRHYDFNFAAALTRGDGPTAPDRTPGGGATPFATSTPQSACRERQDQRNSRPTPGAVGSAATLSHAQDASRPLSPAAGRGADGPAGGGEAVSPRFASRADLLEGVQHWERFCWNEVA